MPSKAKKAAQTPQPQSNKSKAFLVWLDGELDRLSPNDLTRAPWHPYYADVARDAYNRSMAICLELDIEIEPPPKVTQAHTRLDRSALVRRYVRARNLANSTSQGDESEQNRGDERRRHKNG